MSAFAILEAAALQTSMWFDYAKTLLVLAGICLLALAVVKFLLPRLTGMAAAASNHLQVLARYPLEPRKTLYMVRAGKTVVLLAASTEAVHFMTALNPEDFEDIAMPTQTDATNGSPFRRFAEAFADRNKGKTL